MMLRPAATAAVVLLTSLVTHAQRPASTFPVPSANLISEMHNGPFVRVTALGMTGECPVFWSARQSSVPTRMIVGSGQHSPLSQQIWLHFANVTPRGISQMSVTVHGLTGKGQVIPAVTTNANEPSTLATHAELKLAVDAGHSRETELRIDGITSVRTIDLDSVTYDDGAQWQANPSRPCTIEPNRFLLVTGQ
jgi:hypothetical protein